MKISAVTPEPSIIYGYGRYVALSSTLFTASVIDSMPVEPWTCQKVDSSRWESCHCFAYNMPLFFPGNGGEIQWCFSQVKGTIEEDVTEGTYDIFSSLAK